MRGKSGCSRSRLLCPVSLGLALGVTSGLAVLVWSAWMMFHGVPPEAMRLGLTPITWGSSFIFALIALLKGFVFGLVLGFLYDVFSCCCKSYCCTSGDCDEDCPCMKVKTTKRVR